MTDTSTTKGPALDRPIGHVDAGPFGVPPPQRVIFVITGCQKPDRTAQVARVKTVRVFTSRLVLSMV